MYIFIYVYLYMYILYTVVHMTHINLTSGLLNPVVKLVRTQSPFASLHHVGQE